MRRFSSSICNIRDLVEIKLLTYLKGVSCHLKVYKFKHDYQDLVNLVVNFETTLCQQSISRCIFNCTTQRQTLMSKIDSLGANILAETETSVLTNTFI